MWRSVLVVLLMPSMLLAQEPATSGNKVDSQPALRQDYHVVTEWQTMRRGTSEKAIIRFFLIPGYIVSPYEPSRDLVPLKIEFEESNGLAATSFRFDTDRRKHFTFREEGARKEQMLEPPTKAYSTPQDPRYLGESARTTPDLVVEQKVAPLKLLQRSQVRVLPPTFEVAIKLKASKNAALGAHLLRGKITYQPHFR